MRGIAAFAICAIALATGSLQPRADAQGAAIEWGVNGHPFSAYDVSVDEQIALVHDLGLTSYRVNVRSMDDLPRLERLIITAEKVGVTVVPILTPGVDMDNSTPAEIRRATQSFAEAYVSRLKSRIRDWELGNEQENYAIITACEMRDDGTQYNCDWGPAGGLDRLDYYGPRWEKVSAYLRGLSEGVMKVDPTARKAIGTAGWGHIGAFHRLADDGVVWDISVWHMYGQDPEWAFKELARYGKPIWVTEFNHPWEDDYDPIRQSEGLVFWMKRLEELSRTYPLELAHIYELLDEPYWAPSHESVMGLVAVSKNRAGRWESLAAKPSYDAVRDFVLGDRALAGKEAGCGGGASSPKGASPAERVKYAYCVTVRRAPDDAELAKAMAFLEKDDVDGMVAAIRVDAEWAARCPPQRCGSSAFLRLVYRAMLNREPDGVARETYLREIEEGRLTRGRLIRNIVASSEFEALHSAIFGRSGSGRSAP
ncbi:DUF4214 domain-containing protein [bacterium]|nr:DUF4214 domain-containing protein [bacterium]